MAPQTPRQVQSILVGVLYQGALMPPLTFAPLHERLMTLQAIGTCPREYHYIGQVKVGLLAPLPPSKPLAIGIGVDAGLGALWDQSIRGLEWNPGLAADIARERLYHEVEASGIPLEPDILEIVTAGLHTYHGQWAGVPRWTPLATQPAESPGPWRTACEWRLGPAHTLLIMPDLIARGADGTLLVVDHKTGAYAYDPAEWVTSIQLMTYAYVLAENLQEPVRYIVDYLQKPGRPTRAGPKPWECPLTQAFSLTEGRAALVKEWLAQREADLARAAETGAFPRNVGACRRRYGWCDYYPQCVGAHA